MRLSLSLCFTAALIAGCSEAASQTSDAAEDTDALAPVTVTAQHGNLLDVVLARTAGSSQAQIEGLVAVCQAPGVLSATTQDTHTLINAGLTDDGRLTLRTAKWTEEDAVYRDFDLKPYKARLDTADDRVIIRGTYQDVGAMNYLLDPDGEVIFAGPPPIELPISIACADPQGAIDILKAQTGDSFTSAAVGLNEHVTLFRSYMDTDPRFDEVLDACGETTDQKLIDFGYVDSPTQAYQDQFYASTVSTYADGAEFVTMFFPRYKMQIIQGDGTVRIASDGETASGHTKGIMESGPSSESNDFENIEAEISFGCEMPVRAASVINGANRWIREGRSEPKPVSFSVAVNNNDLACNLSAANLTQSLMDTAWRLGIRPTLDFQNPDMQIIADATAENADSKTGCEYRATISANWLDGEMDPFPARNQNYEVGTEVVDQGFSSAIETLWNP